MAKGKDTHVHNVRELERERRPRRREYAVFIGEFPKEKFIYCLEGGCGRYSRKTLSGRLASALGISAINKKEMLDRFCERYWLLDLCESKAETGGLRRLDRVAISQRLDDLKRMMMQEMGALPRALVPALKHNPTRRQCARGRAFGARVYEMISRDQELAARFRPIYVNPWKRSYGKHVRKALQ